MDTAVQAPISERINLRLIAFLAIVLLLIGYPAYLFLDTKFNHGIWNVQDERGALKKVDLKTISEFEMSQTNATDAMIPTEWRALDGQRVMLEGEMVMNQAVGGSSDFDLCYSIAKCCFAGPPKIQHFVKSKMPEGKQAPFISGLVQVKGKLHVGIERDGPNVLSVYRLDVESVKPRS